ncbi:MAG: hypothetical protein IPH13_18930 [Planctomycetes bacterium]|nr:hypothetical protein [Planctomycetota bacterium]
MFGDTSGSSGVAKYNNGVPIFEFTSVTPDWPSSTGWASSEWWYDFCFFKANEAHPLYTGPCTNNWIDGGEACYEFHVPGKLIDYTTSCRIADLNEDGKMDVAFANRGDWQETMLLTSPSLPTGSGALACYPSGGGFGPYEYFSTSSRAAPVFDFIYYGTSTGAGNIGFAAAVELVGAPDDGTAYMEFVNLGGTRQLDWIEANFSSYLITTTNGQDLVTAPDAAHPSNPAHPLYLDYPEYFDGNSNNFVLFGQQVSVLPGTP